MPREDLDVLVVGAGISGIGVGCALAARCPDHRFAILEARPRVGGTWDLFRYPGIRSDSDMFTFGYGFRPWPDTRTIADRESILAYLEDTLREHELTPHLRLGHRVTRASFSRADDRWTVEAEVDGEARVFTARFLFLGAGYYDHDEGYTPPLPGLERFAGEVVHPQRWPEDLEVDGRRVVIIGSGATAITLVPALAARGARVTMLQRSPSYVLARPAVDALAERLAGRLPPEVAHRAVRAKYIVGQQLFFQACRRFPRLTGRLLVEGARRALGDAVDVDRHFAPRYAPWDQRVCLAPDGDFFEALREGRADVVTDHIAAIDEAGVALRSGARLDADVLITATGLTMRLFGGLPLEVDGRPVELPRTVTYKSVMLSDVPNLAFAFGYTNASWTLKVDLTADFVCRLLDHMARRGYTRCVAPRPGPEAGDAPFLDFTSGYVKRALDALPRQGTRRPWSLPMSYPRDRWTLRRAPIEDGVLQLS